MPASVAPGTYYIGWVLDPNGVLPGWWETNNSQALPRAITVY